MPKTDARVRYTKKVIKDALLNLLKEKPIHKITVKEICELAEINRATFYTHYQNSNHLLDQIEDELFEEVTSTVGTTNQIKDLFPLIERNIELCRVLFSENGNKMFLLRLIDNSREKTIMDLKQQYPQATRVQLDYLYEFSVSGSVAVIAQWVRTGIKEAPLELGDVLEKLRGIWLGASVDKKRE